MSLATHIAITKGTAPTNPSKEPEKKTLWYQKPVVIGAVAAAGAITVAIIFRKEIGTLLFTSSKNQDHEEKANNFQKNAQKKTETFFDKILQFTKTENKLSEGALACRTLFYNPDSCKDLQKEDSTCAPTCEKLTEEVIDQQEDRITTMVDNSVCKHTSDFSPSGYFCAYSVAGMLSIKDKIENAALFLKEKICAEQDLPAHKKELLQAEVDSDILSKLTEGQRQGALCYSKAINTLIKEKSTNIENLIKLTPDQRKMLFKEHLSAVQKLIEHKIPLETLAELDWKLELVLTNYQSVLQLLKAGASFEALVNSSKLGTLLESKHTNAILDLLATKKIPFETLANLNWKLERILTNYKAVCGYIKDKDNLDILSMNEDKFKKALKDYL